MKEETMEMCEGEVYYLVQEAADILGVSVATVLALFFRDGGPGIRDLFESYVPAEIVAIDSTSRNRTKMVYWM